MYSISPGLNFRVRICRLFRPIGKRMNKPTNLTRHGYELLIATGAGLPMLPALGEKLERYASRKLAERGVQVRANTKISAVTSREVR